MKFSLKLLLSITLLAVLIVNGANNRHQASLIVAECESIEKAIGIQQQVTRCYEEKKLVYERAATAFQRRKERLADADESFSRVARFHGELAIEDLGKIHAWSLPGDDEGDIIHEPFRIWIPESTSLELCLGYRGIKDRKKNLPLKNSFHFSPSGKFICKLEPGEHFIDLTVDGSYRDKTNTIQVKVDGVIEHAAMRIAVDENQPHFFSYKRGEHLAYSSEAVLPGETVALAKLRSWTSRDDVEYVFLVIRPSEAEVEDE